MSERKTTEIKLRVTPAEKNAWQLAAEDEGIGLSELVRREMNGVAQRAMQIGHAFAATWDVTPTSDAEGEDSSIEQAVPTSDAESRVAKPWMFEARSSE